MNGRNVIMIMVDGFGIPEKGWFDSVYSRFCDRKFLKLLSDFSVPVRTDMGIDGIPQSATGQTALFTGLNAAKLMGMHLQGFPGPTLREIIRENNLFSKLVEKGKKVAFANAYVQYSLEELAKMNFRSVTTIMVESTLGCVRTIEDLLTGKAVYHDITRFTLPGAQAPTISPEQAAFDLIGIARENDFTLFEYFLTDKAGHKPDEKNLAEILGNLSAFVCRLIELSTEKNLVILTGDHGNCEDITTRKHTSNPVPLFVYGFPKPENNIFSIEEVYSFILRDIFGISDLQHGASSKMP